MGGRRPGAVDSSTVVIVVDLFCVKIIVLRVM